MRSGKKSFIAITAGVCIFTFWLPFLVIKHATTDSIAGSIDELPESDAVIVFGTLVNDSSTVSPLLKERLEAGIRIIEKGRAKKIVVSNMRTASEVMARYLYSRSINPAIIEIDDEADDTPDTCRFEMKKHGGSRKVIFVSQGFHLPRLIYQCGKTGINGTAYPAEKNRIITGKRDSLITRIYVRSTRYIREAGLTWLAVLGIYR